MSLIWTGSVASLRRGATEPAASLAWPSATWALAATMVSWSRVVAGGFDAIDGGAGLGEGVGGCLGIEQAVGEGERGAGLVEGGLDPGTVGGEGGFGVAGYAPTPRRRIELHFIGVMGEFVPHPARRRC